MTLRPTLHIIILSLIFGFVLFGCGEKKPSAPDKDDIRFAGFYADYLLLSGVASDNEDIHLTSISSAELTKLLERHYLTKEVLNRKTQVYKDNPELWKAVLVQVREDIRKKTPSGK